MKVIAMNLTLLFCLAYSASSFETRPDCQELPIQNANDIPPAHEKSEDTKEVCPIIRRYVSHMHSFDYLDQTISQF